MLEDGSAVIGEGKGTLPVCTGCENKDVVMDAFTRGENHRAARVTFLGLFDSGDAADLDDAVIVDKETIVGDENVVLEFAFRSRGHADGRGEVKGKGASSHEGKGCRAGIDLAGEDASDGRACCTTTDNDDALAASLGHCVNGEESGRKE